MNFIKLLLLRTERAPVALILAIDEDLNSSDLDNRGSLQEGRSEISSPKKFAALRDVNSSIWSRADPPDAASRGVCCLEIRLTNTRRIAEIDIYSLQVPILHDESPSSRDSPRIDNIDVMFKSYLFVP